MKVILFILLAVVVCLHAPLHAADAESTETIGPNLIYNGGFDNGIWYERYRGWSPAGWYQWFTCGGHAPEHAVGKDIPHTGKEYVRIHMWGTAWRGGVLQNVRNVVPGRWYTLTAYGWFAKTVDDPQPKARIGLDPYGKLGEQFSVDVTKHPAPPYNECVGDDPKTEEVDWPDIPDTTVWSAYHDYWKWGKYETTAEARSEVVTAILYCDPRQRSETEPIYEMNWDTVALREVPWPTKRIVENRAMLDVDERVWDIVGTFQQESGTAQVTWRTRVPAGTVQAIYRFLDARQAENTTVPTRVRTVSYPFETAVIYGDTGMAHHAAIDPLSAPPSAVAVEVVTLSRALVDGDCITLCSAPVRIPLVKK